MKFAHIALGICMSLPDVIFYPLNLFLAMNTSHFDFDFIEPPLESFHSKASEQLLVLIMVTLDF